MSKWDGECEGGGREGRENGGQVRRGVPGAGKCEGVDGVDGLGEGGAGRGVERME